MTFLTELWLPIVLSAVFVFIVSSIIHMVLPVHKSDCKKMQNEDAVLQALRTHGVKPGQYMFPAAASMKDMGSPEMVEKTKKGPVGFLTVLPAGGCNISKSLVQWFALSLLISVFVAYIGWHAFGAGAEYLRVFQVTGTAAILAYAFGAFADSIWKGVPWKTSIKFLIDGIVYGLVTAGTFGWLWPQLAPSV